MIVRFPQPSETAQPDPSEVGAKAASLMRMASAGLPVPAGAVLPASFFAPWLESIRASDSWSRLTEASPDDWPRWCDELKRLVPSLSWPDEQRQALAALRDELRDDLSASAPGAVFAVRSSSPDEDLATAAFAGAYETRLGIRLDGLEEAIRICFASCLDARVFTYKKERGLELWSPRIAVVVQRQLAAEVAGVAFSIDPATNDYDEAAIDANWGLGTSVVEGRVSPDHYVVDKLAGRVVEATLGDKKVSRWLSPEGGTVERQGHRSDERTLSDDQLRELTRMVCRVEEHYDRPMDVEWAWADGRFHLLQARPITTWVPLPPEMRTRPGEPRRLYGDAALSKGLTINEPISPLGLDAMDILFTTVMEFLLGPMKRDLDPRDAVFFCTGGRMYTNFSPMLWLSSPKSMARQSAPTDALMAAIIAGVDRKTYRSRRRPPWLGLRLLWLVPGALWRMRRFFWNALRLLSLPERTRQTFQARIEAFEGALRRGFGDGSSAEDALAENELAEDYLRTNAERMAREMFDVLMPMLVVGLVSAEPIAGRKGDARDLAAKLRLGVEGNVVVKMGVELFRMARLLRSSSSSSHLQDLPQTAERIGRRELTPELLAAWDGFLSRYGWRGPLEMDLARPRYADDPRLALEQMSYMATDDAGPDNAELDDAGIDPAFAQRRLMEERRQAYAELLRRLGPVRRVLLRRVYKFIDLFAGTRDTPKHLMLLLTSEVRRRALAEGRRLTESGRLDAPEHVFDLRFADLRAAVDDASLDLRQLRDERTRFSRQLAASVRWFPQVIDSRGRILRPPAVESTPGLLSGMPVSPGVVRGPVKILHQPHDQRVEKGDVLVAYTTDPGWTPLFVNAAAIVLEVGGVLQHGAVVAREYGKPCVVGIDRVVTRLSDGEIVEVDGASGTVRRVAPQSAG